MTATLEAIYENGVLKLKHPLPLPENAPVTVTIRSDAVVSDPERADWLALSRANLHKTWENSADDVFNELL